MKKIFLIALPSLLLLSCGDNSVSSTTTASSRIAVEKPTIVEGDTKSLPKKKPVSNAAPSTMEFIEMDHDFGNIFYPSDNLYTFKFKNTGTEPIIIESAKASCGCTIPKKPEEPVLPGEIGEIDVIFRPKEGQAGHPVTKRITVLANTEPKATYLNVKANVLKGM